MVPSAVMIARSSPRDSTTVIAGRPVVVDGDPADVDPARPQLVLHEPAERIVAHHAGESHPQTELGGGARHDGAGAADREGARVHEAFGLPERRGHVPAVQHQIGVRVAQHQQIEIGHGVATIPACPPSFSCGATSRSRPSTRW